MSSSGPAKRGTVVVRVKGLLVALGVIFLTAAIAGAVQASASGWRQPSTRVVAEFYVTAPPTVVHLPASSVTSGATGLDSISPIPISAFRTPVAAMAGDDPASFGDRAASEATHDACPDPGTQAPEIDRYGQWMSLLRTRAALGIPRDSDATPRAQEALQGQTTPAVTPAPPLPVSSPAQPAELGDERWIDVDLTTQTVTAYEGAMPVRRVTVSTGLPYTPTPVGQFRIWVKFRYDDMEGHGYLLRDVPYTMYFHGGYGLHGTYWHSNFGHPMSHGCVNLPTSEAEWLFHWAEVGTLVNVHS